MLEELKQSVYESNMALPRLGLVIFTWGNVSAIDRATGLVAIKPSGVEYDELTVDDIVLVDLDGNVVEGHLRPSSDTPTHLELYRGFPEIGGVVHTHSNYATAFAQACREIPAYGTTHADTFYGAIPCTRPLDDEEIRGAYEKNTGTVILETFSEKDEAAIPGVLVANHGVFTWGKSGKEAVHNAAILERVAEMAYRTEQLNSSIKPIGKAILNKHYLRKHGKGAYYGQK